ARWQVLCEASWRHYAERCGYEVVLIREPLDKSARAKARSPSWQKCLVLGTDAASQHERIIWVDADIIINATMAPPITEGVPIEKIGAVDESTFPTAHDRQRIVNYLVDEWSTRNAHVARNWKTALNPPSWHHIAGLPKRGTHILQAGVLVLSPTHHRQVLEPVYNCYEDVGGGKINYEMRPLSFEVQDRNMAHWIDSRFNALIFFLKLREELLRKRSLNTFQERAKFLEEVYQSNYFLHFAGGWMHLLEELQASGLKLF